MTDLQVTSLNLPDKGPIKITWELEPYMPGISVLATWPGGSHRHMFNLKDAEETGMTPMEYAVHNQNWVVRERIIPKLAKQFNIPTDKLLGA
jgi:hypothetical protein